MKKLICLILTVCMLFALAACGETKPAEPEIKEWTRQGTFEDENGNHLIVNLSETEGYEGWAVSLMLDGEAVGWITHQEGNALRGNLNGWDENLDPFNVTITEEGEDGLKLEVEGGETYYFTPVDMPEATIIVTVNIEGWGHIAYAEGEEAPEIDPEFPAYLTTAYAAIGPQQHTVYLPIPMALRKVPEKIRSGKWGDRAFAFREKCGDDHPGVEKLFDFEAKIFPEYDKAREEARKLLREGKTDEAVKLLNECFERQFEAADEFLDKLYETTPPCADPSRNSAN